MEMYSQQTHARTGAARKGRRRQNTASPAERTAGGNSKVHLDDPGAQAAVTMALKDIRAAEGSAASSAALGSLMTHDDRKKRVPPQRTKTTMAA